MTKATVSLTLIFPLSRLHGRDPYNELEPEVKISLTESWIVASHHPAEHTRTSNEHKLSRHLRVESVEAHKAERLVAAAIAACSSSNSFAFAAAFAAAAMPRSRARLVLQ